MVTTEADCHMNTKKIIGFIVGVIIFFVGVMIIGFLRAAMGTKNIGAIPALLLLGIMSVSFSIARFVYKRIQKIGEKNEKRKNTVNDFAEEELILNIKNHNSISEAMGKERKREDVLKDENFVFFTGLSQPVQIPECDKSAGWIGDKWFLLSGAIVIIFVIWFMSSGRQTKKQSPDC